MVAQITAGVSSVLGWLGDIVTAIFGTGGALADLAPAIGIAIAISIVFVCVKMIKKVVWGY